jgi:Ca-activated chloride channel family protein
MIGFSWTALWWTPDQQGQRYFNRKEYAKAAEAFRDPMWEGTAWYRAGEFKKAAQTFANVSTPEARFNEGNALLLAGKYQDAISRYDEVLEARPDWKEAQENRDLAIARFKILDTHGGDAGDQKLGADKVVFDKKKPSGGQDTEVAGDQAASNAVIQSMWLRRVQTKPADFLKAKFAYQLAMESEGADN